MKTAILAVMLGLAVAQDIHRGRPFQNSNQALFHQQPRQLPPQQQQPHQPHQQQQQPQQPQPQPQPQPQLHQRQHHQQHQQQQQQQHRGDDDNSHFQEQAASHVSSERKTTTTPIPILQWNKQQEHDGTYRTSYETGNNIIAEESGYIKTVGEGEDQAEALVQQGSYSYTSPEGQIITVQYIADETGFRATGDHIPTPPPVSAEIQKGLDLIYAGIRQQQEAAAREAAQKGHAQPLNQQIDRREDANKFRP